MGGKKFSCNPQNNCIYTSAVSWADRLKIHGKIFIESFEIIRCYVGVISYFVHILNKIMKICHRMYILIVCTYFES